MPNIWILNHYANTPYDKGITRHYELSHELVKRGYSVTIFTSAYNHFTKNDMIEDGGMVTEKNINGIEYVWIKTYPKYEGNGLKRLLNMMSYFWGMLKLYKKYESPNVIIGSSVHLLAPLAAYFISKRTKAKFLCEIRDLWPQTLIEMGAITKNHPLAVFFRIIENFVYKKCDIIITLLPGIVNYLSHYGIDENKVRYIPNGVDLSLFDENMHNKIERNLDSILSSYFCCLYTGAHGIPNSLDVIVKAAGIIKNKGYEDIRIILIGNGTEKNKLIEYCRDNEISNVIFYDSIDKRDIPSVLSRGRVNLLSTKDINLYKYGISPNKLFDYLASANPIIFSGNTCNDIVKEAHAGLSIPPENPDEFANAIIKLYLMSEKERMELGQNGREYVKNHHDLKLLVDELEKCFKTNLRVGDINVQTD